MKKRVYMYLAISIILNIVLIAILIIKSNSMPNVGNNDNNTPKYFGLYQTTYYNNYNKQIILTIRLQEDYTCTYGEFAAEYAGEGSNDCKYSVDGKNIKLTRNLGNGNEQIKEGQILDSGALFIGGKQLNKID